MLNHKPIGKTHSTYAEAALKELIFLVDAIKNIHWTGQENKRQLDSNHIFVRLQQNDSPFPPPFYH